MKPVSTASTSKPTPGGREETPCSLLGKSRIEVCLLAWWAAFLAAPCHKGVWEQPLLTKGSGTLLRSAKLEDESVTGKKISVLRCKALFEAFGYQ